MLFKRGLVLADNSLAYIVYEADNIASGVDRVNYDDEISDIQQSVYIVL